MDGKKNKGFTNYLGAISHMNLMQKVVKSSIFIRNLYHMIICKALCVGFPV